MQPVPGICEFSADVVGCTASQGTGFTIVLKYDRVHNNRKLLFLRALVQRGTGTQ